MHNKIGKMDYSSGNAMFPQLLLSNKVFPKGSYKGMKTNISELEHLLKNLSYRTMSLYLL